METRWVRALYCNLTTLRSDPWHKSSSWQTTRNPEQNSNVSIPGLFLLTPNQKESVLAM